MTHPSLSTWYIGANGGSNNKDDKKVIVDTDHGTGSTAAGGYSHEFNGPDKTGTASNNDLTIDSGGAVNTAYGGYAFHTNSTTTSSKNALTIKGAVNDSAYGGWSLQGTATDNTVTLAGGTVKTVYGGYAPNGGEATLNKVIIENGTATGTVYGGFGAGSATYNKVTIEKGGTVNGTVFGGNASGDATHNTVTLAGGTAADTVYGGFSTSGSGDELTGNTLAVTGTGSSVGFLAHFDTLDFTLPADITDGGKMLTDTGAAQFVDGSGNSHPVEVKLAFDGDPTALNKDESVTLITSTALKIALKNKTATATTAGGNYEFVLDASDNKNLIATLQKVSYSITATATPTAGGGINCDYTSVEVGSGTTVTCTLNVNEGYEVSSFSVVGDVDQSECGDPCVLKNIASNVDVSVEFVKVYKVNEGTSEGGTVTCDLATVAESTGIATCTADAEDGYTYVDGSMTVSGGGKLQNCSDNKCELTGVTGDVTVSAKFTNGGGGGSFAPAVLSIDGNTSNTTQLQPGKANAVQFTLGAPFEGYGTLKITGVTKSLQKASLDSETVNIVDGKFTANITPEKGEKTVTVNLTVKDTPVNKDFTFTVAGSGGAVTGTASPVPTLGEVGLLLSGIALAGAAAPALRRRERRERKERKQD